ncbi:tetratricopeptide repeat protein [bacterium]|nr:tetratricopeptide repeat protein [bacterium]
MSKVNKLRRQAQDLLKKGKLDKAIGVYKKLLYGSSSNPNLSNELGDIYLRSGDRIQAISTFENALENYEKVALYNNAVAVCKKILRVAPGRLTIIYKLGELKAKQNFSIEAAGYFSKYLELLLADSNLLVQGTDERIEKILELMEGYNGVISKAVDVLEAIGMGTRASEINAKLIQDSIEDGDKEIGFYKERMERLKSSLSEEECERIDRVIDSIKVTGLPKADDGMHISDVVSETVVGNDDVLRDSEQFSSSPDADSESQEKIAIDKERAGNAKDDVRWEKANLRKDEREDDFGGHEHDMPFDSDGQNVKEKSSSQSQHVIEEPFFPPEFDDHDIVDREEGTEANEILGEEGEADKDSFEDLSGLNGLDDENEVMPFEKITSDVEKDDFKSHYDLGMAYIEMALFDEAIKELQISSRSEELNLRSLEMIGHCFIQKRDFRLAVKQLERGAEVFGKSGDDNLGIHYNLGLAYEALGDVEKAREHFEEVYIVDVTFRDIPEKMKKFRNPA